MRAAALVGLAAMLAAGGCRRAPAVDPAIITVGIRTAPNTLDPRQAGDEVSQRVSELIFSPLFILGPDLSRGLTWRCGSTIRTR